MPAPFQPSINDSDKIFYSNPYNNMHPTLIPKLKPLSVNQKIKYTGNRP